MKHNSIRVADAEFSDPAINTEYFNAKYKEWLKRRGFTDELERMSNNRANLFRNKKKKLVEIQIGW